MNAEEAVSFCRPVFRNSRVLTTVYYGEWSPVPKGRGLTIDFELCERRFTALNGGAPLQRGWPKDRFDPSWQMVPIPALITGPNYDPVIAPLHEMVKPDVAKLNAAEEEW